MKILFVTNLYPTKENPDYGVFTKDQIDSVLEQNIEGDVLFINAREEGLKAYINAFLRVKRISSGYDLIHCFHGLSLIISFFATKKTILVSFLNNIKYESLKNNKATNFLFANIYQTLLKAKRVFSIHKDSRDIGNELKRSFYLPNGVDINYFRPVSKDIACEKLGLNPKNNYVLFVSSKDKYRKQKRYDRYKDTLELFNIKNPDFQITELVMTNVPREMSIYYYNCSSAHLLTSDYEGSPNSVKEAMSCNVPVVSTNVGNVKEMFKGSKSCFVVDSFKPELLADALRLTLTRERENLRDILIMNKLTKEQKTKELIEIYKTIYHATKNT